GTRVPIPSRYTAAPTPVTQTAFGTASFEAPPSPAYTTTSTARTAISPVPRTAAASASPMSPPALEPLPLAQLPARPCRARGPGGASWGPGPATRPADRDAAPWRVLRFRSPLLRDVVP